MADGNIVNTGKGFTPFSIDRKASGSTEDSTMGMRGPSISGGSSKLGSQVVQTHVPPSTGGGVGGVQNVGELKEPFSIGKNR